MTGARAPGWGTAASPLGVLLAGRADIFAARPGSPAVPGFTPRRVLGDPRGPGERRAAAQDGAGDPVMRTDGVGGVGLDDAVSRADADAAAALARAREDGFAAGVDEGRARAEAALDASLADLARLADALVAARAFDPAELAAGLADCALWIVSDVLEADPALPARGLATRAERALATLADARAPATLWLAPPDAAALAPTLARAGLDVIADPTLARGALRLTTRDSRLDDSIADRLARLAPAVVARARAAAADTTDGDAHAAVAPVWVASPVTASPTPKLAALDAPGASGASGAVAEATAPERGTNSAAEYANIVEATGAPAPALRRRA